MRMMPLLPPFFYADAMPFSPQFAAAERDALLLRCYAIDALLPLLLPAAAATLLPPGRASLCCLRRDARYHTPLIAANIHDVMPMLLPPPLYAAFMLYSAVACR